MSSTAFKQFLAAGCCAALALSSVGAKAAEPQRQEAIEIGQTAIELFEQGKYRVALDRFRAADRALHSPVFQLYEARCLERLGRLVEARTAYQAVVAERLPADAPAPWRAAFSDASVELAALAARVPSARVISSGLRPTAVTLDGAALDRTSAGAELWLDPGVHRIEASDPRGGVVVVRFELAEGERNKPVHLSLPSEAQPTTEAPPLAAASAGTVRRGTRETRRQTTKPSTDAIGITLLSTGATALVLGTVTGLLAASKLADIREHCIGSQCRKSDEDKGETVATLALASTVAFSAGGAAFGAWGLRVYLSAPSTQSSALALPTVRLGGWF